ncbi:MAG: hypothetical protein US96_C0001G0023 [Candidatus Woesebacteria bacterium GW2011_GWB1_38_5b]|uniref:Bacterial Ig domain-containing protein n=1 Tax=Candidatus Woesebacteria bacterium GW2011_GWB1_38_5b TaxID=1618569 RepID=A0A0G0KAR8_9BACT|nr:MAG: hypothetical protein US96_C0001G0023 [Candidatus Woesebacteria bacterium GW2011_GWB1_38_5b]
MAYRPYSRLEKIEHNKNLRTARLYIFLTIGVVLFLAFFGIKVVTQVARLFFDINSSSNFDINDSTPPAPPFVKFLPEYTNQVELVITGTSEPGSTVEIKRNETEKNVLADNSGSFTARITLDLGENNLLFRSIDKSGNESLETRRWVIIFDNKSPDLTISKPKEGDKFFGPKQQLITVEGATDNDSSVTINERVVIVGSSGSFSYPFTLSDGENSFNIKSSDRAGNLTEITIKVNYSP